MSHAIERLGADDEGAHEEVRALLTRSFGRGPLVSADKVRALAVDPSVIFLVVRRPDGAASLAGVGVAGVLTPEKRAAYAGFGDEADAFMAASSANEAARRLGSARILAVDPACRRTGVGLALGAGLLEGLRSLGCDHAVGVCWDHGGDETSRPLFERGGFRQLGQSREFYRERQRLGEHDCRYCGVPCTCLARLYAREL